MRLPTVVSLVLFGATSLAAMLNERFVDEVLVKRQQFTPTTTTAEGATCADAFGAGYVTCRNASDTINRLCYNPSLGQSCCGASWACPSSAFCLVEGTCCPNGQDPKSCAAAQNVTITPGFKASTGHILPQTNGTAPGTVQTSAVRSSPAAYYTGAAANPKAHVAGLAGILIGAVAMI